MRKCASVIIVIAVSLLVLYLAQCLVVPKYMSGVLEGGMTREYYEEELPHDVIFIGDCEVYENISPITLWEEYGMASYIRGSAQQLIWQSYYLLKETFRYESPKAVVFNVLSMKYDEPQSEAYNRMTFDGMKPSYLKYEAVKASAMEDEDILSYFFPILRYHSRMAELTDEDIRYMFRRDRITHAGYLMRIDVKPMTKLPMAPSLPDYSFGEVCFDYLEKMRELCQENGAELILIKSPSLYPHWYPEWDEQVREYAEEKGLIYINYADKLDEAGIDMSTDTYDGGLHLNLSGAEKFAKQIGAMLIDNCDIPDRRGEPAYDRCWKEKSDFYYDMIERQKKELEEFGYLKSWTLGK
ncbi:MAG: SGNH/GDSL hydrolase family protein [Christensenellaceae bacterium]|nr:SGNH/GDSL hydrolase family protein [Christensenellaceae bacterium]